MPGRRGTDAVDVDATAVQVHRQDGPGLRGQCRRDTPGVHVDGLAIDVDEDRRGTDVGDGEHRGHVGVGYRDDLVAGPDAEGAEREGQRGGALETPTADEASQ